MIAGLERLFDQIRIEDGNIGRFTLDPWFYPWLATRRLRARTESEAPLHVRSL